MIPRIVALALCAIAISGCDKFRHFLAKEQWKWSSSGIAETKRRGDIVCHAVDAYRAKTGKYPLHLEDIQPEFLRDIPKPAVGHQEWDYMVVDEGRDYWLHVSCSEFGPQLDKNSSAGWSYMRADK